MGRDMEGGKGGAWRAEGVTGGTGAGGRERFEGESVK